MSAKKGEVYPHERRVIRYAYASLAVAALAAGYQILTTSGKLLGIEVPPLASLGLLALGALLSIIAIARRSTALVIAGAGVVVASVLAAGGPDTTVLQYAIGVLFGVALLAMGELVHMTERYERAHRAVEKEGVPEEHINRVTDEALKTLASRAALAALAVAASIAIAFALSQWGPRQWRAATETSAPLGVAVAALALAGAASLSILARGAKLRLRREAPQKELLPDVAE